jgi:hypothetical protein
MNAKFPRLIARCRHHAALTRTADRDRLAAQIRIIALLDRRIEGIHIDMDDLARSRGVGSGIVGQGHG